MGRSFSNRKTVGALRHRLAAITALTALTVVPQLASATETDRLTVEDPVTSAVKFRLTSEGNVTGGIFTGDGSGLANVAHFKGVWSGATAYLKDDCVSYNGSSYIALAPSSNAQPDITPASWTIMAAKGAAGDQGIQGIQGIKGDKGDPGATGPAGSPDTQAQILTKLAGATDGAQLLTQQGPTELGTAYKIIVKDAALNNTLTFTSNGNQVLINPTGQSQMAQRTYTSDPNARPVFGATRGRGTLTAPAAVQKDDKLGTFSFGGWDGAASQTGALLEVFVDGTVSAGSVPSRFSVVTGSSVSNRAERLIVKSDGNVGIGVSAPAQKLDIAGAIKLTSTGTKTCDDTTRGSIWFTNGGTSDDTMEVCAKVAGAYVWKKLW